MSASTMAGIPNYWAEAIGSTYAIPAAIQLWHDHERKTCVVRGGNWRANILRGIAAKSTWRIVKMDISGRKGARSVRI